MSLSARSLIVVLSFLILNMLVAKTARAFLYRDESKGCHTVHIFSLQYYGKSKVNFQNGHSAIAVDNEFFDYGSKKQGFWGSLFGRAGGPYLDRKMSLRGNLNTEEAYRAVPRYRKEVYQSKVLVFAVTEEQAQRIFDYWKELYMNPEKYSYLKRQCTSTVYSSLVKSKVLESTSYGAATQLPKYFYNYAQDQLRFTCGRYRGSAPLEILLY